MNAETIREIRKQMTPDLAELLKAIIKNNHRRILINLLASTDAEARQLITRLFEIHQNNDLRIEGWLEAGFNCTNDADIVPYALAEALDSGEPL